MDKAVAQSGISTGRIESGPGGNEFVRGFIVVANRELTRLLHDRARMISSLAQPLMFFVIFGAGFNRMISSASLAPGVGFIQFLFPGIVAQTVFMTSIFSGLSVVWDREFGFLRELLVAPISRLGIVFGKVVGSSILAMIQATIIMLLAPLLHVKVTLGMLLLLYPLLVLVSITMSCFGILLASRVRSQQAFQMIMQLVIFPMIFLAGIFFPLTNVPGWLAAISKFNPLTYGVDAIRHVFLDVATAGAAYGYGGVELFGHPAGLFNEAIIMAISGLVMLLLALQAFTKQE
ncbi:MAG TPA: ABC transporter permease [Alphaproteobacteria bacterium]|nr:ABC transporter permease [Alphaproteobacteria bacterium]